MLPTTLYESTFNSSPVSNCLLSPTPDAIILAVNEAFLRTASRTREDLVGVSLFSAFPANADDPRDTGEAALRASILQVIASGTPDALPLQRYAMLVTMPDGRRVYEERIWSAVNTPIFDQDGVLACIFHRTTDVTKQVEAEHALRLSEQRYRGLFESIDQGFCIVEVLFDPDGKAIDYRFCDVNPAFEAQTGFDDVIGKTIRELAPGHEQRWFDFFGRVARTGEPVRFESEAKALNRWYEVKAFRVDDPAASRVAVLFDEITARRLAEQDLALKVAALEVAERRQAFQLALADRIRPLSSPHEVTAVACELLGRHLGAERVVYGEADDTGDFLRLRPDWTAGALTTMGGTCLTLDEFGPAIADTVRAGEVLAIDDVTANAHSAPYAGVYLATGIRSFLAIPLMKQGRLEAVLNVHDSAIHPWTEAEIALAHDVVDRIWAAVRYVQEAQKRKEVETQLREKVAQLQFILEAAKIGDAVMDLATGANTHSLQHDRCFGYTEPIADWSYEKFLQHVHPDDRDYVSQDFQDSLAGQKNWHVEFRAIWPDHSVHWIALHGSVHRENGEPKNMIGIVIDITERKRAEQQLQEADRRKDEFLAMLAHELRNPLAPIGAAAELLQIMKPDEERVRQTSRIIGRQVRHMTSLVDDLLDVSRVTRGLVELDDAALDISHVVTDAIEQVTPLIRARRHHLVLEMPPEAPLVTGDRKRLVQVVVNLLNNAAKYTREGGHILLRTEVHGAHVLIRIVDSGIGMAPELVARAFDLFAQAERTSDRSSGGLGLGLALVKSLVELHHGTVQCESAGPGMGSTFTVCLPLRPLEARPEPADAAEPPAGDGAASLRILVVDDNVDAAAMLAMLLEAAGHDVSIEHGSHGALERAKLEAPQVCLLDIGLPDIDGNELAQRLRAEPETADAILIAVTGYGQESDREQTLAAGFDFHLVKPVDTRKLSAILALA